MSDKSDRSIVFCLGFYLQWCRRISLPPRARNNRPKHDRRKVYNRLDRSDKTRRSMMLRPNSPLDHPSALKP